MNQSFLKLSGVGFAVLSLGAILFLVAQKTLHQNWIIPATIIGINLLILIINKIFPSLTVLIEFKEGQLAVFKWINHIIVGFGLVVTYVLGVGFVWLFSRFARKKFMIFRPKNSTWEKAHPVADFSEPF